MLLDELASLWDADDHVRNSLRTNQKLLLSNGATFHATVAACSENYSVLVPVLKLTKEKLIKHQPTSDDFQICFFLTVSDSPTFVVTCYVVTWFSILLVLSVPDTQESDLAGGQTPDGSAEENL